MEILYSIFISCFLWLCRGLNCAQVNITKWSAAQVPNPMVDASQCGNNDLGLVCNPDSLLTDTQVQNLNSTIYGIIDETACNCLAHCDPDRNGFSFSVLVVQAINVPTGVDNDTAGNALAEQTRKSWSFGDCDNDAVIVVATQMNKAWIATGASMKFIESDACVSAILQRYQGTYSVDNAYNGIDQLLAELRTSLKLARCSILLYKGVYAIKPFVSSDDYGFHVEYIVIIVILAVFFLTIALCFVGIYLCRKKEKNILKQEKLRSQAKGELNPSYLPESK